MMKAGFGTNRVLGYPPVKKLHTMRKRMKKYFLIIQRLFFRRKGFTSFRWRRLWRSCLGLQRIVSMTFCLYIRAIDPLQHERLHRNDFSVPTFWISATPIQPSTLMNLETVVRFHIHSLVSFEKFIMLWLPSDSAFGLLQHCCTKNLKASIFEYRLERENA